MCKTSTNIALKLSTVHVKKNVVGEELRVEIVLSFLLFGLLSFSSTQPHHCISHTLLLLAVPLHLMLLF